MYKNNGKIAVAFVAVVFAFGSILAPVLNIGLNSPALAANISCQLNWGGLTEADGTGIRQIGGGSDWSISVSGLQSNEQFRLENTNLRTGQITGNGTSQDPFPLQANQSGNFSLYDNTQVDTDGRYTWGRFRTDLVTAGGATARCTPSFVIYGNESTPTPTPTMVPANCDDVRGNLSGQITILSSTTARGTVTNSSNCTYRVSLASYKLFQQQQTSDLNWVYTQQLVDSQTTTVGPYQTVSGQVALPNCRWQVDLVEGNVLTPPTYTLANAPHTVLDYEFGGGALCGASTPTPTPVITPVPQVSGNITANPNPCYIAQGKDLCTSNISWNTNNVSNARVYVSNTSESGEKLFAQANQYSNYAAPWIKAYVNYTFRLYDYSSGGRGALLDRVSRHRLPRLLTRPTPHILLILRTQLIPHIQRIRRILPTRPTRIIMTQPV